MFFPTEKEMQESESLLRLHAESIARFLRKAEVPEDGNCLFRSVAHTIGGAQHHAMLHSQVVKHVDKYPDVYRDFFVEGFHGMLAWKRRVCPRTENGVTPTRSGPWPRS